MSDIRALRKSLKAAERQAARERQARFTAKMKENGMKHVSVWVTADNAELIRLLLAAPQTFQQGLLEYLRKRTGQYHE